MSRFMESLESRSLLSVSPVFAGMPPLATQSATTIVPLKHVTGLQNIVGVYTGTIVIPGIGHNKPVTLTITGETKHGLFSGLLTASADVQYTFTGRVLSNTTLRFSFTGSHQGGTVLANGTGTIVAHRGGRITMAMGFQIAVNGGTQFPGTLNVGK